MPYHYIENIATSDIAIEIWAVNLENLFKDSADALTGVMIEDPLTIEREQEISFNIDDISVEMLLFSFLQELIFIKDKERLLCRLQNPIIGFDENTVQLRGILYGERINPSNHKLLVDVKAVTLHQFFVRQDKGSWRAQVILDI